MVDTVIHNTLTTLQNHNPFALSYTNQTARLADTSLDTNDVYKFAIQVSDDSIWILLSVSPNTWANVAIGTQEVLSASNVGSGADVFYQKTLQDLEFNGIKSENDRLAIALDAVSHDIELTLVEGNIIHQNISGAGSNSHGNIDSHMGATIAHGATGAVVGTTNPQSLSLKTLVTPTIASFVNAGHDHSNAAGGGTVGHGVLTGVSRDQHHTESHSIDSHDTTATGTELNTLVNAGSNALHYHDADRARANHTGTQDIATVDGLTAGSVVFGGATGLLAQDNANLFYDVSSDEFGIGTNTPSWRLSIGSADGSDQVGIHHDNTNAYFKTTDGSFIFITDEGTNTNSLLEVRGKGTGYGQMRLYDQDNAESLEMICTNGQAIIRIAGSSPGNMHLQNLATSDVTFFSNSGAGNTKELRIYGYRALDALRVLSIGTGVDAADTASFDGVSNYLFSGSIITRDSSGDVTFSHDGTNSKNTVSEGSEVVEHGIPVTLADAGSFTLPDATSGRGWFLVGNSEEYATIVWDSNGVVDLIDWSANIATTDTGGKFCFIDSGTQVTVKNNLGSGKKVMFHYNYWTP